VDALPRQNRALSRQAGIDALADAPCAALLLTWVWGSASPWSIGGWLAATAAITAARLELARRQPTGESSRVTAGPGLAEPARRWSRSLGIGSALGGSAWGIAAVLYVEAASPTSRLLIAFLIGCRCSFAAGLCTVYPPAFAAFATPALAGLASSLAMLEGSHPFALAGLILLSCAGGYTISRTIVPAVGSGETSSAHEAQTSLDPKISRPTLLSAPPPANLADLNRSLELRLEERSEALRKQGEALRDAQRLAAIGRLAGGVAHDFNNLLTIILADLSELASHEGIDPRHRAMLREMGDAGSKGAALVQQLLTFSRRARDRPGTLDLNRTLGGMDRLLYRLFGEGSMLKLELQTLPVFVHMDPTQMEQVIVNLITNARDAVSGGGVVSVRTDIFDQREKKGALEARLYARVLVSDTGIGMDAETRQHIFEPFFTTKADGKGTGLGLSTAYAIVRQGGGEIEVSSAPGQGSRFSVYLPLAEPPRERHDGGKGRTSGEISGFRPLTRAPRHVTVLLVEDEPTVRSVTRRILESAGHTVLTSPSAERALEIAGEHPGRIELLITDVVMAGMDGPALSARLHAARTELRTLFISGYGREQVMPLEESEATAFLAKPFTHDALLSKVVDLLDQDPADLLLHLDEVGGRRDR
jgi:two-component system cell cycle sensor histidine kinase/response regulator CckA